MSRHFGIFNKRLSLTTSKHLVYSAGGYTIGLTLVNTFGILTNVGKGKPHPRVVVALGWGVVDGAITYHRAVSGNEIVSVALLPYPPLVYVL